MIDHNVLVEQLRFAAKLLLDAGATGSIARKAEEYNKAADAIEALTREVEQLTRERDNWTETARFHCKNEAYYRSLCEEIGKLFGWDACRSDDGSLQQDIICLKVPELVRKLFQAHEAAEARLAALTTAEGCDVEAALAAHVKSTMTVPVPENSAAAAMSDALAAGCAPLRARYEHVVEQARIISRTGVNVHALPSLLVNLNAALAALDGGKS